MISVLRKTYSWLDRLAQKKDFQFILILFFGAFVGFQAGEQFNFYNLSKKPEAALTELIYKKCLSDVNVTKDIFDEWATKAYICGSEELAHVRDKAFKMEIGLKSGQYYHECEVKKEDQNKCLADITSAYQKRLEKYHELKDLMN